MKSWHFRRIPFVLSSLIACLLVPGYSHSASEFGELSLMAASKTDKAMNRHGFTEIYERFFFPLRNDPIRFFEIGIAKGGSLVLWSDYFPKASIFAIDIVDKSRFETERVKTFIADQANREQLKAFIDTYGSDFDVILDDGGHKMHHQQISFGYLMKHLKPGGLYIIEDLHTSLWRKYQDRYGLEEGSKNATLVMIERFIRTGVFVSQYLTPEEEAYLTTNVEYCNLFARKKKGHVSITGIFKKRGNPTEALKTSK